jgi:hypothetical protein
LKNRQKPTDDKKLQNLYLFKNMLHKVTETLPENNVKAAEFPFLFSMTMVTLVRSDK